MKVGTKNILLSILAVAILLVIGIAADQYYRLAVCNIESRDGETHYVYIPKNCPIDSVESIISNDFEILSPLNFRLHCRLLKWQHPLSGAYTIGKREGDLSVIRRLRNGEQTPVKISFKNVRTKAMLSRTISSQLMLDSADIASRLDSLPYMEQFALNEQTAVCMFIPDTYEMFWNISPDGLFQKMYQNYTSFWDAKRRRQAAAMGLTPTEVITLASIVESETFREFEKPIVAGLYYNRLRKGMRLQADPTVIFAMQDFTIRRVTNQHLKIDSPYNTYKYAGLPPGPIRTPYATTINAVLNYDHNNYLYMCANADFSMTHKFATNYHEHLRNAREYQRELNKRGVK